jgi:hypothetical protein
MNLLLAQTTTDTGSAAAGAGLLAGLGIFTIIPIIFAIVWAVLPFMVWVRFNSVLRQLHAIRYLNSQIKQQLQSSPVP